VAVAVRHLADGRAILPLPDKPDQTGGEHPCDGPGPLLVRRYHHVVLDRAVPLRVSGAVIETLDLDSVRQDPVLHRWSMVAGLAADSQSHSAPPPCLRLRDYEARTLRQMQAA
jgi:hypothetical protein